MSGGEVAGILVAVFWAILVSFLAVVLVRLAQTLKATTKLVADVTDQAVPLLADASATVRSAQTQLDRVDAIASDVQEVTVQRLRALLDRRLRLRRPAGQGRGVRLRRAPGDRRQGEDAPAKPARAHRDRRPYRARRPPRRAPKAQKD